MNNIIALEAFGRIDAVHGYPRLIGFDLLEDKVCQLGDAGFFARFGRDADEDVWGGHG